jgi:isocitrate/isopropylmalate dehydrogenase
MAKFSIAWMPGDGIGNDVMEATRIVLDAMKLDAEYIHTDIGWDFWCKEGNALPDRSIKTLQNTTCGLFGAITSKPEDEAKEEPRSSDVLVSLPDRSLADVQPPHEHAPARPMRATAQLLAAASTTLRPRTS